MGSRGHYLYTVRSTDLHVMYCVALVGNGRH